MKIFLDIDGVLSTNNEFYSPKIPFYNDNEWAEKLSLPWSFNKDCVEAFNKILDTRHDIEIVLSSDWRNYWSLEELDIIFKNFGVKKSPVDYTTKNSVYFSYNRTRNRVSDIEEYLLKNSMIDNETETIALEEWIIIDDLNVGAYLPEELKNRFFLTSNENGLLENNIYEQIIKYLSHYETEK